MKEIAMTPSRRDFLKNAVTAATFASVPLAAAASESHEDGLSSSDLTRRFDALPGRKGVKIYAPATEGKPRLSVELEPDEMLFVASAIKTFVLCEAMRQVDSPDVVHRLDRKELALDDTVWSFGSPTFNPPLLTGTVSERTALEAMITRSDNTATDMIFKLAGADNIRRFIAAAGLKNTLVPDSTRAFTAYLLGADDYLTITWAKLREIAEDGDFVHPFLNPVETLASSAGDLVSYYSRALQGAFFEHAETLQEFRRIQTLCDFIYLVPLPLGVSAYAKSGNADSPGFHARSMAGGMYFPNRWVYFAFIINWDAAEAEDPKTVSEFFSAINHSLTRVRDSLSE